MIKILMCLIGSVHAITTKSPNPPEDDDVSRLMSDLFDWTQMELRGEHVGPEQLQHRAQCDLRFIDFMERHPRDWPTRAHIVLDAMGVPRFTAENIVYAGHRLAINRSLENPFSTGLTTHFSEKAVTDDIVYHGRISKEREDFLHEAGLSVETFKIQLIDPVLKHLHKQLQTVGARWNPRVFDEICEKMKILSAQTNEEITADVLRWIWEQQSPRPTKDFQDEGDVEDDLDLGQDFVMFFRVNQFKCIIEFKFVFSFVGGTAA